MKFYTYAMLFTLPLATLCAGCQVVENPIYDEADIIELIQEHNQPPIEPVSEAIANDRSVPLKEIVNDIVQDSTIYEGQTVKTRVTINIKYTHSVLVATYRQDVSFIIVSPGAPERLDMLEWQKTYDVTISIYRIIESEGSVPKYSIWAEIETDPVFVDVPPELVSVIEVVEDVASGNYAYISKSIKVTATVSADTADWGNTGIISFQTGNDIVAWVLIESPDEGTFIPLRRGETYTFTMYIDYIIIDHITLSHPEVGVEHYTIHGIFQSME